MRIFAIAVLLTAAAATFADGKTRTAAQQPTNAAIAIEFDPEVVVMDIDEAKQLTEDTAPKSTQPSVAVQPTVAPRPPETRVIELDPPPVAIVNRTNQFRILSRRPAERPVAAPDTAEEAAEE